MMWMLIHSRSAAAVVSDYQPKGQMTQRLGLETYEVNAESKKVSPGALSFKAKPSWMSLNAGATQAIIAGKPKPSPVHGRDGIDSASQSLTSLASTPAPSKAPMLLPTLAVSRSKAAICSTRHALSSPFILTPSNPVHVLMPNWFRGPALTMEDFAAGKVHEFIQSKAQPQAKADEVLELAKQLKAEGKSSVGVYGCECPSLAKTFEALMIEFLCSQCAGAARSSLLLGIRRTPSSPESLLFTLLWLSPTISRN